MIKIAKMNPLSIIKYVMSVVGLISLVVSFYCYEKTQTFIKNANVSTGIVVELIVHSSHDGDTYTPVVLFKTKKGELIQFTYSGSSNPPICSTGELVEVLYNPVVPNKAEINKFWALWFPSLLSGILGLVFSIIGICFFINTSNNKKKKSKIIIKNSKYGLLKNNS